MREVDSRIHVTGYFLCDTYRSGDETVQHVHDVETVCQHSHALYALVDVHQTGWVETVRHHGTGVHFTETILNRSVNVSEKRKCPREKQQCCDRLSERAFEPSINLQNERIHSKLLPKARYFFPFFPAFHDADGFFRAKMEFVHGG